MLDRTVDSILAVLKYLPGSFYVWLGLALIFTLAPRPADFALDWWILFRWASWVFLCVKVLEFVLDWVRPSVRKAFQRWQDNRHAVIAREKALDAALSLPGPPTEFLLRWVETGDRHGQFDPQPALDVLTSRGIAQFVGTAGYQTFYYEIESELWAALLARRDLIELRTATLASAIAQNKEIAKRRGRI